jgi:hypothetical protein
MGDAAQVHGLFAVHVLIVRRGIEIIRNRDSEKERGANYRDPMSGISG